MPRETTPIPPGQLLVEWHEPNGLRWQQYTAHDQSGTHVIPQNDDKMHECTSKCYCIPYLNNHGAWIHRAFDCREEYEEGYRKKN